MSQRERSFPQRLLATLSIALAGGAVGAAPAQASHTVSCRADLPVRPGEAMTWRATVSGGSGSYGYAWSGSGGLSGTTPVVTNTYDSTGYKLADVSVTDLVAGETAGASCQMHVVPASFSEPPHVVPVLWVPADVDPAPMLDQLNRAWRAVRALFYRLYGRTFRTGDVQVVVSSQTEAGICGGDCTDLGLADQLMSHAIDEVHDRLGPPIPYTRALHVMAWGAGGWAGSWGWETAQDGVGDITIAPAAGVATPVIEPDLVDWLAEALGSYDAIGISTLAHELNHTIGWDDPHDFDPDIPPNEYETQVSLAGPFLTETPADPVRPTVDITQPAEGATVAGTVSVGVDASDDVAMDAVVLTVDDRFWAVDTTAPYAFEVDTTQLGSSAHTIAATAYDAAGNAAKVARRVEVRNEVAGTACANDFPSGTLHACFYDGIGFGGPYLGTLVDHPFPVPAPNTGWGIRHSFGDEVAFGQTDTVTGVWRGTLDFPPATYILQFSTDDGLRVYVDGELVIDEWHDQIARHAAVVALDGPTRIQVEWFENGGGAALTLHWRPTRLPVTTAPTVASVAPAEDATGVPRDATVSVTFSKPMDQAATQAAFSLVRAGTTSPVSGTFTWSGNTMTFDPSSDLVGGATYTARVTTAARDAGGTALAAEKRWQFGTVRHVIAYPTATFIWAGTLRSGDVTRLRSNDDRFYQVNSTTSGMRTSSWYGKFTDVPNSLSSLRFVYRGRNSTTCRQTLSLWHWPTGSWVEVDARSVGTSEVAVVREAIPSPADYVSGGSGGGDLRLKVRCTHGSQSFYASGDEMRIGFDVS